jgi:hypothetical protein
LYQVASQHVSRLASQLEARSHTCPIAPTPVERSNKEE